MKIFFSMRHPGTLRNFGSTIREVARRGHESHLSFGMQDRLGDGRLLWELTDDCPSVTYSELTKKTPYRFWLGLARGVRLWADYLRYLGPEYREAFKLRERAEIRLPGALVTFSKLPLVNSQGGRRVLWTVLLWVEPDRHLGRCADRGPISRRGVGDPTRRSRIRPGRLHQER